MPIIQPILRRKAFYFSRFIFLCCLLTNANAKNAQKHQILITDPAGQELRDDEIQQNITYSLDEMNKPCNVRHWWLESNRPKVLKSAHQALNALGYFQPQLSLTFEPLPESQCWLFRFVVTLGPLTKADPINIKWSGDVRQDVHFQLDRKHIEHFTNQVLRSDQYEFLKLNTLNQLIAHGYLLAKFQESRVVVHPNNQAKIFWHIHSGKRFKVRHVIIDQQPNRYWHDAFIQAMSQLTPNQWIKRSTLIKTKSLLENAGVFRYTDVQIDLKSATDQYADIIIRVTAKNKHEYRAGLGYSSDLGARLRFKYNNNRVNRQGHRYLLESSLSEHESQASGTYTIPSSKEPSRHYYDVHLGGKWTHLDNVDSNTYAIKINDVRQMENGWKRSYLTEIIYEDFTAAQYEAKTLLTLPGITLQKLESEGDKYSPKAYWYQFSMQGGTEYLLSDIHVLQSRVSALRVNRLTTNSRLLYRIEGGFTWVSNFSQLPPSKRFYAGGSGSIRGFSYQSLGPRSSTPQINEETGAVEFVDKVVGGKHLAVVGLEWDFRFKENWVFAIFTDIGNAFNNSEFDIHQGAGIGLRWFSPAGPITLDLGFPITESEDNFQIHFSIGSKI